VRMGSDVEHHVAVVGGSGRGEDRSWQYRCTIWPPTRHQPSGSVAATSSRPTQLWRWASERPPRRTVIVRSL
jgi:hypothetical protein